MTDNNVFKLIGLIFLGVGVLILGGAILAGMNSASLLREGVRTTGNVIELLQSYDDEGDLLYTPVFLFLDEQGREHRVQSKFSSSPPGYRPGQAVELIYRPGRPETADVTSFFGLWGLAGILGMMGVGFIFFGLLALWVIRAQDNTTP
jgi:hypothetical protein